MRAAGQEQTGCEEQVRCAPGCSRAGRQSSAIGRNRTEPWQVLRLIIGQLRHTGLITLTHTCCRHCRQRKEANSSGSCTPSIASEEHHAAAAAHLHVLSRS